MKVKELLKFCKEQVALGNGEKEIYISADEEGNSYYKMYYAFTQIDPDKLVKEWKKLTGEEVADNISFMESMYYGIDYKDMKNSIILG